MTRPDVALAVELLVRRHHGPARHPELGRQGTSGRQRVVGAERPVVDQSSDPGDDGGHLARLVHSNCPDLVYVLIQSRP
ncbi:hypothetical protein DEJ36_16480 [Curtobacterium sp. MCPF17_052]|nr:hypothetical protein [Curtobacterium sp. MCPF17_052]WIB12290.1 hypothetical protein DEJ36_16480 [Curtobacterium sp. MCPF17_052]